jgi:hypothetical protein
VRADVVGSGVATAIAVKARQGPFAAGLQRTAEHVFRYFVAIAFHAPIICSSGGDG